MLKSEEQLKEIIKRSEILKERSNYKKKTAVYSICSAVCLVLICVTSAFIPYFSEGVHKMDDISYGSLVLSAGHMGYVIIGFLAFVLGILITMLCFHLKELHKNNKKEK